MADLEYHRGRGADDGDGGGFLGGGRVPYSLMKRIVEKSVHGCDWGYVLGGLEGEFFE